MRHLQGKRKTRVYLRKKKSYRKKGRGEGRREKGRERKRLENGGKGVRKGE